MILYTICVFFSSLSFLGYGISYFLGTHMKTEFKRFGLEKFAFLTVILEMVGSVGLIVGYIFFEPILILSAAGLTLLMFLGVIVRLKIKDSFLLTFPALFYLGLNFYIFWFAIN